MSATEEPVVRLRQSYRSVINPQRTDVSILVSSVPVNSDSVFSILESAARRPKVFSRYTATDLWTDEHTSAQMLAHHLNTEVDVSSRRAEFIDQSASWMIEHFNLSAGSRIADFGCGPGLYCSRLARQKANILGIDFSSRSIAYAREFAAKHCLDITYVQADYLEFEPDGEFDLIIMIMCDFCALSPAQRSALLSKFNRMLSKRGRVVIDVYSEAGFGSRSEAFYCEKNQLNGFWSANPYYALVSSFKYEKEQVSLDKYTIIEKDRHRQVYNWLQHFSPESLRQELATAGLEIDELYGDVAGDSFDAESNEFAVVIKGSE